MTPPHRTRARTRLGAVAAAAVVVATLGAAPPVSASASESAEPPAPGPQAAGPLPTLPIVGLLASDAPVEEARAMGEQGGRERRDDSEASAFVYRQGRFTPLADVPGAAATAHIGNNDRGDVVGAYTDPDGVTAHGFVRSRRGGVTTIDVDGAVATLPIDINNDGVVSGTFVDRRQRLHGFLRAPDGEVTVVDRPGATETVVTGLNDREDVVGTWFDAQGGAHGFVRDGRRFRSVEQPGASATVLFSINDDGRAVGAYVDGGVTSTPDNTYPPGTVHGLVWDDGELTTLDVPGSTLTGAQGIDDHGRVSGGYADRQGRQHGFVWRNGRFTVFDAPGDRPAGTNGFGINDHGEVVVPDSATTGLDDVTTPIDPLPVGPLRGFVLDDGEYRRIDVPGARHTLAYGIDDHGRIAGGYEDAGGGVHGFVRSPDGDIRTIDVPGAYSTIATRINDRGQVVGDYFETEAKAEQGLKRGFMLDGGRFIRIDVPGAESTEVVGLDNRGRAVGETLDLDTSSARGFLWDDGRFRFVDPGAAGGGAEEINERGQITGIYADVLTSPLVAESTGGYLLDRGRYTRFTAPGGPLTQVFGLNNRERIVGYTADLLFRDVHGFVRSWDGEYTAVDVPFGQNTMALGIDDAGRIVGSYEQPTGAGGAGRTQAASAGGGLRLAVSRLGP